MYTLKSLPLLQRAGAGIAAALLIGLPSVLIGGAAGAAAGTLPVFPNNINVFPNRDFVNIQGYAEHIGEQAKVEVTRAGAGVVGSAIGTISGADVAFEINHPGGICWGAGTGLNVTPDLQAGDVVTVTIAASPAGPAVEESTTVQDMFANDAVQNGTTLIVTGHIGPTVDPANTEQRIIEPALVDTVIGKRDIRAVPGPLTPAPKGGYQSSLEFDPGHEAFTATYIFDNLSDATIAANAALGERAMAWEVTDVDGNRQGMTIAENGEPGGPGMGGCPNGPLQSGPPGPSNVVAANVAGGIQVNWTPVVAIPGTQPILGYRVTAVAPAINGEQIQIGKRINNPGANSTTITGLDPGVVYDIEIVSFSSVGETFPPVHAVAVSDVTPPTVSASPGAGSYPVAQQVTLTANELGSDIYYTIDGSDPVTGGQLSTPEPTLYTGPITIGVATQLKFAAFDPSNNVSDIVTALYEISNDPVPAATAFTSSSVGVGSITLTWAPADPGIVGASIVNYQIDVYTSVAGTNPVQTVSTNGPVTTFSIAGLTGDTPYWFTVRAMNSVNSAFGPPSALLGPLTPQGAVVANAGPDQSGVVRNTTVTLSGAGSSSAAAGATYAWTQLLTGTQTASDLVTLAGTGQDRTFTLPFYKFPMVNSALTFQLTVTLNGASKTDTVLITPRSDTVTITTAKWKQNDFRVVGTSTTVGGIVTVRSATTNAVLGSAAVTAAAPPAVGGVYDVRVRQGGPATNPGSIKVDSNMGGTAGPFTVSG